MICLSVLKTHQIIYFTRFGEIKWSKLHLFVIFTNLIGKKERV